MVFEWDADKNTTNLKKHGVSFPLAAKVFLDKKRIEMYDREHSTLSEDRYKVIGLVDKVLVVIYTERKETIRLISARKAQQEEINEYYRNYDLR